MRTIVAVTLFVLAVAAGVVALGGVGSAQLTEPSPCEQACEQQRSACVTACGERPDPVECESACEDALLDCLRRCG